MPPNGRADPHWTAGLGEVTVVCMCVYETLPTETWQNERGKGRNTLVLQTARTHTHTAAHELIIQGHARIMAPLEVDGGMWCVNRMFVGIKHNVHCSWLMTAFVPRYVCEFKHDPRRVGLPRVSRWDSDSQGYIIQPVAMAKVYSINVMIRIKCLISILHLGLKTENVEKKIAKNKTQASTLDPRLTHCCTGHK